jgi:hypothetical protein
MGLFDSSTNTSTTNTTSTLPDWLAGTQKQITGAATQVAARPYSPYPNQRIAGFTPDQQKSFDITNQEAGSWAPFIGQSQQGIQSALSKSAYGAGSPLIQQGAGMSATDSATPLVSAASQTFPGAAADYMSPYQDQVISRLADLGNRNLFENILPNINDTFIKAGQFGSSRNGDFTERAIRDTQEAIQGQAANSLNTGYQTAGQLFGQDQSRLAGLAGTVGNLTTADAQRLLSSGQALGALTGQDATTALQGARQYADLGNQQQSQYLRDATALSVQGGQQQAQNQKNEDLAYQDFTNQRDYDKNQIDWLSGVVSGQRQPASTNVTTQTPGASPISQVAGTALTLGGLPPEFWAKLGLKRGGYVREMADGGLAEIAGADDGGWGSRLSELSPEDLRVLAMQTTDPEIAAAAQQALAGKGQDTALSALTGGGGMPTVMGGAGDDEADEPVPDDEADEGDMPTQVASAPMSAPPMATPLTQAAKPSPLSSQAQSAVMGNDPTGTLPMMTTPAQQAARERLGKLLVPGQRGAFESPLTQIGLRLMANRKPGFIPALGEAIQGTSESEQAREDKDKSIAIKAALQDLGYADKDAALGIQFNRPVKVGNSLMTRDGKIIAQAPDTPTTVQRDYKAAQAQGYAGTILDFIKEKQKAGAANTTVNLPGDMAGYKQLNEKGVDRLYSQAEQATAAVDSINAGRTAKQLIDKGIIAGTGADFRKSVAKAFATAGLTDGEDVANTDAYFATMGRQVLSLVKGLGAGTGISNADRDFAAQVAGGNISLTPETMKRIIDINERASTAQINRFNTSAKPWLEDKNVPEGIKAQLRISVPAASGPSYDKAPVDPTSRKKGQTYLTPKGPMQWTGTGWLPAQAN